MSDGMTDESRRDRILNRKMDALSKKLGPGQHFGGLITDPLPRRMRELEEKVSKIEVEMQKEKVMRKQYANDSQLILKIQGLRMVSKEDMIHSMRNETTYRLRWEYKGSSGYMDYKKVEDRDNMFNKIVIAISPEGD